MPTKKKRPGHQGDFGRETPHLAGTTAHVNMWFAAWHLDHGHTVPEAEKLVDILRKLEWTPAYIYGTSASKLLEDLHSHGYVYEWAPRLVGDMERAMTLKYSQSPSIPKTLYHDLPELVIPPNEYFIESTPPATALCAEVRAWLGLWFSHRPHDPEFKQFSMRFQYQCPFAFLEEVMWDGVDIVFFALPRLKRTLFARYLRGPYVKALGADIREGRKKMRARLCAGDLRQLQAQFNHRVGA